MRKTLIIISIATLILIGIISWLTGSTPISAASQKSTQNVSSQQIKLELSIQNYMYNQIIWTRMWLISFAYNNGDTDEVAARLLKNQEDIGNFIKPYYGNDAGNKLTALLKNHVNLTFDLVKAIKAHDNQTLNTINTKWYSNANQIADNLYSTNPNWSQTDLRRILKDYLDLTKQEAMDILAKNYQSSISDYDNIQNVFFSLTNSIIASFNLDY